MPDAQEDKVMERRMKRMASQRKLKETNAILSQLQAARRTCQTKDPPAQLQGKGHGPSPASSPKPAPASESSALPFQSVEEPPKRQSPRARARRKVSEEEKLEEAFLGRALTLSGDEETKMRATPDVR